MTRPASLALACLLLVLAGTGLGEASRWVDRPFPGFLVLENRVVASAALPGWPATRGGEIFQHQVVAIDGVPVASAAALRARVGSAPSGTPFRYTFRGGGLEFERTIPSRRFSRRDFALLFGGYLLNGLVLGGCALGLLAWRRHDPGIRAALPLLGVGAVWGLTAMDLYGPYRLFRLHALAESLLFAAALHAALWFPLPLTATRRRPWLVGATCAAALALAVPYQALLHDPDGYVVVHLLATALLGASLMGLMVAQLVRYLAYSAPERQLQVTVLAWGGVLALSPLVVLTLAEPLTGGSSAQNAVGMTAFLFALAIAFAGSLAPGPELAPARSRR